MASVSAEIGTRPPLASLENRAGYAPMPSVAADRSCAQTILQEEARRLQKEIDELSVRALSRHVKGPALLLDRVRKDLMQLRPKISAAGEVRDGRDEARDLENGEMSDWIMKFNRLPDTH